MGDLTYWAKTSEETIKEFSSSEKGLDDEEVDRRLAKYGLNDIPVRKKSAVYLLISQMKDVLIIALTIAAAISLFTGGVDEAIARALLPDAFTDKTRA